MIRETACHLDLTLSLDHADLQVSGEVDLSDVPALARLLCSLEQLDIPVVCHMSQVQFVDSHGLRPFLDSIARRQATRHAPLTITEASPPVQRMLILCGA